jgi:hypothetical protein
MPKRVKAETPSAGAPDELVAEKSVGPSVDAIANGSTGGKNSNLSVAKGAKNDEFYTQWADIEREMNAYLEYDPDVFRGKVILLPCDDPEWSNFAKFFALHFADYGIKKLISTSYAPDSKPSNIPYQPTLFETENPRFDPTKTRTRGKKFVLEGKDINNDGVVNIEDLQWDYLDGDGDFRSEEVTALRNEADIVITNPPFSLFREFVAWLVEGEVKFSIIGNMNAITYKEVFPLIRDNKIWLGATNFNTGMFFRVPENFVYAPTYKFDREQGGVKVSRVPGVCWYANLEHGRRHEPLSLMTEADNLKYSKHKQVRGVAYQKYDNYDAIEVPFTDAIPSDYDGLMGVPISFLDKYNPEQFEVVGITKTWDEGATKTYPKQTQVSPSGERSSVSKLNDGPALKVVAQPLGQTYYEVDGEIFVQAYARILIRRKSST